MSLRLRQVCLVAGELDPVVDRLCAVLGVAVCHRDGNVGQWGLSNALMPLGTSFLEVVAPLRPDTAAGRYLARRGGDGGYMAIFDTQDLDHWRRRARQLGIRIAATYERATYRGIQLHPRDTGGTFLDINSTLRGNGLRDAYGPAGPDWQDAIRTARVRGTRGIAIQGSDPAQLAQRWSEILASPMVRHGAEWHIDVDTATLRFVDATDGRGEGLSAVDLDAVDPESIRAAAAEHGCLARDGTVSIGSVEFRF